MHFQQLLVERNVTLSVHKRLTAARISTLRSKLLVGVVLFDDGPLFHFINRAADLKIGRKLLNVTSSLVEKLENESRRTRGGRY